MLASFIVGNWAVTKENTTRWYVRCLQGLALMAAIALLAFVIDYAVLRSRNPQFGSVTVHRFYRIPQKSGKIEIQYDGDYTYDCARSLFPHSGDKPCWYLSRKTEEWVDVNSGTPNNPHIF